MEIWMVNLKLNCESVINGKRPCVILSSWKTCVRQNGIINLVPLTTNLVKYLDVHIDLEGYNLKEISKALCNQILTIDKKNLLFRVGMITDISTQLRIESALESQMDLRKTRLNVEDTDDLENFFIERVKNISNRAVYENLKKEIRDCTNNNMNEECIIACDKLYKLMADSPIDNKSEYLWVLNYYSAIVFNRLEKNELALIRAKESLKYVGSLQESLNQKFGLTMWCIGYCYSNLGNNEKAFCIYKSLASYYKKENKRHMRINVIFNIAKLKKNVNKMKFLIKLIEDISYEDFETKRTKTRLLKQMEEDYLEVIAQ